MTAKGTNLFFLILHQEITVNKYFISYNVINTYNDI